MTSPLTELQALGRCSRTGVSERPSVQGNAGSPVALCSDGCSNASDEIDTCATCGEIVCQHSDADYRGWSDPDAGLAPVGGV